MSFALRAVSDHSLIRENFHALLSVDDHQRAHVTRLLCLFQCLFDLIDGAVKANGVSGEEYGHGNLTAVDSSLDVCVFLIGVAVLMLTRYADH